MDIAIIFGLILLNGVFAMSEIAIVSSKRIRLQQAADQGDEGAKKALLLAEEPTWFLSTIQVGITLIGILAGAFGEAAIAQKLEAFFLEIALVSAYAKPIAWIVMVIVITYVSLIFGELVPKRLALMNPELIARLVSRPMDTLSRITHPLIWLLSTSTELILKLLRVRPQEDNHLIEEEIHSLIKQGGDLGILEQSKQDMMTNVLRLDDKRVGNIMTLYEDLFYVDLEDGDDANLRKIATSGYAWIPACSGNARQILGMLSSNELLGACIHCGEPDLKTMLHPVLFVPLTATALELLDQMKQSRSDIAIVTDAQGDTMGLVSMTDLMMAIVSDLPGLGGEYEQDFVARQDGSWLVSGLVDIASFKNKFAIRQLPDEADGNYHTLGGLILSLLDRVPSEGEMLTIQDVGLEVVDMDGKRVDKVLVKKESGKKEAVTRPE
jgi:putative hemolysin